MDTKEGHDEVVIPALLRGARGAYGKVIASRLVMAGFDDLPRNGPFVLGGMAHHGGSAAEMMTALQVSKQAASQLTDVLVTRGYLVRQIDPDDRRRMLVQLTDRGRRAAAEVRAAIEEVDEQLAQMVSPTEVAGLRAGLIALSRIRESYSTSDDSEDE